MLLFISRPNKTLLLKSM